MTIITKSIKKALALVVALIIVTAVALTLASCGEETKANDTPATPAVGYRSIDEIKQSGTIKIAVFIDKSPFGYLDANGKNTGFDVYYGDQLAEDLGVKVEYVPVDGAARVSSLEANKVDVVLANFTVTPERKEKVDFTYPYMKVALGIASKASAPINSLDDVAKNGLKLTIVKGTTAETYLEKNYPDLLVKATKFDTYAQVQEALADGRADGWLTDNTEAISYAKSNSAFVVPDSAAQIGDADTIAPAVAKGNNELHNYINNHIKTLTAAGFFKADYEATLADVYGTSFEDKLLLTVSELK